MQNRVGRWVVMAVLGMAGLSCGEGPEGSAAIAEPPQERAAVTAAATMFATLCTGVNYTGVCVPAPLGAVDSAAMIAMGIADEAVQSIKVAPNTYVWAYQNAGFTGTTWTIVNNVPDLSARGASLAISSFVVGPSPSTAFNVYYPGGTLCLDLPSNSNLDGTKMQVATCTNTTGQAYRFQQVSPGVFNVLTQGAQKCLDVVSDANTDLSLVEQRSCTAKYNTANFRFTGATVATFGLQFIASGKCLDVLASGIFSGTPVDQFTCNSSTAQTWNLGLAAATTTPPVDASTTFRVLPLSGDMANTNTLTVPWMQAQMQNMVSQIGQNQNYFRVGFTQVYNNPTALMLNAQNANLRHLSMGVILPFQTHDLNAEMAAGASYDLRNYQWRQDGQTWQGLQVLTGGNQSLVGRDWQVVTPSRYSITNKKVFLRQMSEASFYIAQTMVAYPNVIAAVSLAVEEELAIGGQLADGYLGDYSPFAVAEFRDWIRHKSIYDDLTGARAGEGAPLALVGNATIAGANRSPFYDDPTPANANGTGTSFNATYGTAFTNWSLAYWNLDANPGIISDPNFDPTPTSGTGFIAGGFDAPRVRDPNNAYWNLWSYDLSDHNNTYPAGDPNTPLFGFRQTMVKHFLNDLYDVAVLRGVPANIIYSHQIAAEFAGTRGMSGADPMWSGVLNNGNLGNTRFGNYDAPRAVKYSRNWGLFEWHPSPYATPSDPNFYNLTIANLDTFFTRGGYVVVPYAWGNTSGAYPFNNSGFATALRDWLASRPDQSH